MEYLSRSDAEFAAKDLDGRDLRGQPVTVTFAEDVRSYTSIGFFSDLISNSIYSAVQITSVVMTVTATGAIVMIVTVTVTVIASGTKDPAADVQARLLVVRTVLDPLLLLGNSMKRGETIRMRGAVMIGNAMTVIASRNDLTGLVMELGLVEGQSK